MLFGFSLLFALATIRHIQGNNLGGGGDVKLWIKIIKEDFIRNSWGGASWKGEEGKRKYGASTEFMEEITTSSKGSVRR